MVNWRWDRNGRGWRGREGERDGSDGWVESEPRHFVSSRADH